MIWLAVVSTGVAVLLATLAIVWGQLAPEQEDL